MYNFITNNFEISREEVAFLYKLRWNIELLFKKLKQNFSAPLFLFRDRERDKNPNMVYVDRAVALAGIESEINKQKSLFYHSCIGKDTPDQQFGCVLDGGE